MNKKHYLLRLDDACPTMDGDRWGRMEVLLDKYGVQPMVGIIPANKDPKQKIDTENPLFWDRVKVWEKKGWAIALHGYDHHYISTDRGINPLWPRSEFAGVPLEKQKEKITKGIEILASHDIHPSYFFAPSHTFDENTLTALRDCSDIRIISDTIAFKPYKYKGFTFVPQLGGHCTNIPLPGIWTFCLHPSVMSERDFLKTEQFINKFGNRFISFKNLNLEGLGRKSLSSKILSFSYFQYRKFRRV